MDHRPGTAMVNASQLRLTRSRGARPLLLNVSTALWMALILLPRTKAQIISVPKVSTSEPLVSSPEFSFVLELTVGSLLVRWRHIVGRPGSTTENVS